MDHETLLLAVKNAYRIHIDMKPGIEVSSINPQNQLNFSPKKDQSFDI